MYNLYIKKKRKDNRFKILSISTDNIRFNGISTMYAIKPTSHNNILSSFSNNIHGMLKNKKSDFIGFFILILMLDVKKLFIL